MNEIRGFQGSARFLSNFWPSEVRMRGVVYPSVEAAYQAAKTEDLEARARIAAARTPGDAKRLGKAVPLRPGWDGMKETVMLALLRAKFRRPELRRLLLATGDALLVEDNAWGDRFWGVCRGEGQNRLGLLLMQVRAELNAQE